MGKERGVGAGWVHRRIVALLLSVWVPAIAGCGWVQTTEDIRKAISYTPPRPIDAFVNIQPKGLQRIESRLNRGRLQQETCDYFGKVFARTSCGAAQRGADLDLVWKVDSDLTAELRDANTGEIIHSGRFKLNTWSPETLWTSAGKAFSELGQQLVTSSQQGPLAARLAQKAGVASTPAPKSPRLVPAPTGATVGEPGGIYALETAMDFNVLDRVTFDPATGRLTLIGRRDPRYSTRPIPYLQHLATLLEHPRPEFSLRWTPESRARVDAFFARSRTPAERRRAEQWMALFDKSTGRLTANGRLMFPAMGIAPAWNGRQPGYLGAGVADVPELSVRVASIEPRSPAAQAGLQPGDIIMLVDGVEPLTNIELSRYVRLKGAGSTLRLDVRRGSGIVRLTATLAAATGDPWTHVAQTEGASLLMHAAGNAHGAQVHYVAGLSKRFENDRKAGSALVDRLMALLGMKELWTEYEEKARRGEITREQGQRLLARTLVERYDAAYRMTDRAGVRRFDELVRTRGAVVAMQAAMTELDERRQKSGMGDALDTLWARPDGIQVPAELVERAFGVRPDVVPEYTGVDSRSQIARVMFDADYLGKKFTSMPELKQRIPRYQTLFAFERQRDQRVGRASQPKDSSFHMWISVDRLDLAQAPDGATIEIRRADMRFNIREKGRERAADPPAPGSYEHLLTSLYDDLAREFPDLHELREAAKLAAVAHWIESRRPGFRLPAAGRIAWNGPAKAPGVTYLYMHSPDPGTTFTLTWMPQGGVSLVPFPQGSVRDRLTPDATVVDLRPSPSSAYGLSLPPRILGRPLGAPTPRPVGWTAAVEDRGRTLTAATVIVEPGFRDAPADLRRGRKSNEGTTLWRAGDLETAAAASCGPQGAPGDARERAATLLHCATVRYSMGDNAGALRAFDDALKLGATLAMIRLAYAKVLFDTGDFAAAEAELKRYLALEPGNQAAMRLLAQFQAAARSPARGVGLGQAYQAAVENATDIARAGLKSGEKAAEAAGRVFDQGVSTPPAVAVGSGARPIPPGLANDERMKSLQTQKTKLLDQNAELQKKLDDVRARKARGEGDRGRLDVEETNLKQQQVGVRGQIGVLEVNIIDLGVKWEEEQKQAAPTPAPGGTMGNKQ